VFNARRARQREDVGGLSTKLVKSTLSDSAHGVSLSARGSHPAHSLRCGHWGVPDRLAAGQRPSRLYASKLGFQLSDARQ
jgi:hypothetical protein